MHIGSSLRVFHFGVVPLSLQDLGSNLFLWVEGFSRVAKYVVEVISIARGNEITLYILFM